MAGTFVNRARFASIRSVSVELCEVRSEEDPQIDPCAFQGVETQSRSQIRAGGHADFSFARKHDWSWLTDVVYVVKGPINKTFAYAVWIEAVDEFGNVYRGCSARRHRHVFVPKGKRLAGVAAQTASINALAFIVFKFLSIGWKIAATAFAKIAKDPPDPDFDVSNKVSHDAIAMPVFDLELPATIKLIQDIALLAGLEEARTQIRAKLIGARIIDDENALNFQKRAYVEVEEAMVALGEGLTQHLEAVERELQNDERFEPERLARLLSSVAHGGLPENFQQAFDRREFGSDELFELQALTRDADFRSLVTDNGPSLLPLIQALQGFVGEISLQRDEVMAGEEYVRARSPSSSQSAHLREDPDAAPLPARRTRGSDCGC